MDTFWVIPLLIFGAIVSIGQKASKNTPSKKEGEDAIPTPEQEDIERRIREIFEGKADPEIILPPLPGETKPTPRFEQAPESAMRRTPTTKPHKGGASAQQVKRTQNSQKKSSNKTTDTDPIKQGEVKRSEIGRIINDFDIEKATIYAEIMKPKYEEY